MIEYLKTAGQTAKKNGCTLINNKLVADFSAVKKFLDNSADELDKIGLTAEEVFKGVTDAAINDLLNRGLDLSEFLMVAFCIGGYHIEADILSFRKAVYVDDRRKYGVLQPAAARFTMYFGDSMHSALNIGINEKLYRDFWMKPIEDINI